MPPRKPVDAPAGLRLLPATAPRRHTAPRARRRAGNPVRDAGSSDGPSAAIRAVGQGAEGVREGLVSLPSCQTAPKKSVFASNLMIPIHLT